MKQKIIKIGNSQGIILPKEALDLAGLKTGEDVYVIPDPNAGTLTLSEKQPTEIYSHNVRFKNSAQKVVEKYKVAWKSLANVDEK